MASQLHKRLPRDKVVEVLSAFNAGDLSEARACALLGVKRSRLYTLQRAWLNARRSENGEFRLRQQRQTAPARGFPSEIAAFLHNALRDLRDEAQVSGKRLNFAALAAVVERKFGRRMHRNSVRRFAIRHGYYR